MTPGPYARCHGSLTGGVSSSSFTILSCKCTQTGAFQMPATSRKDASKKDNIRGFASGDTIGAKRVARGNTGPEWLAATATSSAPGGFYDYEVEYKNPSPGNK